MKNRSIKSTFWLFVITLFCAALACNLPSREAASTPDPQLPKDQTQVTHPSSDSTANDTQTLPDEALALPGSQMTEPGLSRVNPYPIDTQVTTPYWDFKVLEFHRGEAAWQIIQSDDPNNAPAPAGKEYALVKVWVRNKIPSSHAQNFGLNELFITGDALQVHGDVLVDHPTPEVVFSDIFSAEILEGWMDVLVDPSEQNLMLVFDRVDSIDGETQPRVIRYIALERDASLEIPTELEGIAANDLGLKPEKPAKLGETVIGEDWEVTVLETVTGAAAFDIVMQMNQKNDPPEEGMEYIALLARMRRLSGQDLKEDRPNFWTYVLKDESGGWETIAEPRIRNMHPELYPIMEFFFFPGLESEGWFVLTGPTGQTSMLATIDVGGDAATSRRYFQLTP